jgi:hypothetical protein
MEENTPKNISMEKIIRIVFIVTLIITAGLLLAYLILKYPNQNDVQTTPNGTGAFKFPIPATEKEVYDELYNLMEKGEITSDYFKIEPIYQDRTIQITVKKPLANNKVKAETWLKENGYSNVPTNNIIYLESK